MRINISTPIYHDGHVLAATAYGAGGGLARLTKNATGEFAEEVPRHHGDPFDRLIIAQAQVEGLTVVTCDGAFRAYGIPLLW